MVNLALVGRCGIYCGSCGLYRAYKDGGEYLRQVAKTWKIHVGKIRCEGCHALTQNCLGFECGIVRCLNSKGFEYCFECPEYERRLCEKYEEMTKKWGADDVDLRANLERIRAGEAEAWLKECEERFRCEECGKPLPVFGWNIMKKCYHCGKKLHKKGVLSMKGESSQKWLISVCGLNCAKCDIYQAGCGDKKLLDEIIEWFRKERNEIVKPEQIKCEGCGGPLEFHWSSDCKMMLCAKEKGLRFCFQCEDFPCSEVKEFSVDGVPHHKKTIENAKRMKEVGIEAWIEEQKRKGQCVFCP